MITESQIEAVAERCLADFPTGTAWKTPDGYPHSLALCILDSIWSIGVNYDHHVIPVLHRYRTLVTSAGRDANIDTPADLLRTIDSLGGPDAFAVAVGSRHRTSSRNGILKADAVHRAAKLVSDCNVLNPAELGRNQSAVKAGWHRIPGQRSGVSWKYLLMLAGIDGIKPDRMIHGYITEILGVTVTNQEAVEILTTVQRAWPQPRPSLLELDHAIWRRQSGRSAT